MARISILDLKKIHGISQADIDLARDTQEVLTTRDSSPKKALRQERKKILAYLRERGDK